MNIILGIDAALRNTGYGIVSISEDNNIKVLKYGMITNHRKFIHSKCLQHISEEIKNIIQNISKEYNTKINEAIMEGVFHGVNSKTAMILGYVKGCVMSTLVNEDIKIYSYPPKEVKRFIGGSGNASKQIVAEKIADILDIDISNMTYDITDALSLAICHINYEKNKRENRLQ